MSLQYGQLLEQNAKLMAQLSDLEATMQDLLPSKAVAVDTAAAAPESVPVDAEVARELEAVDRQISLVKSALLRCARLSESSMKREDEEINAAAARLFSSRPPHTPPPPPSSSMDQVAKMLFCQPAAGRGASPPLSMPLASSMDDAAKKLFSSPRHLSPPSVRDILSELIDEECLAETLRLSILEAEESGVRAGYTREQRWRQLTGLLAAEANAARRADDMLRHMTKASVVT